MKRLQDDDLNEQPPQQQQSKKLKSNEPPDQLPRLVHAPEPIQQPTPMPSQEAKTIKTEPAGICHMPEIIMKETLPLEDVKQSLAILPDRIAQMIAVIDSANSALRYAHTLSQLANIEANAINYSGNASFKIMTSLNEVVQNIGSVNIALTDENFRNSLAGLFGIATSANCVRFNIHKSAAQYFQTYDSKN